MEQIKINSGIYQCEIVDETGKSLGVLEFYPNDFNLPDRLDKGWKNIQKCLDKAKDTISDHTSTLKSTGDNMEEEDLSVVSATIAEVDKEIKEQLDYIFDADMSGIFGNTHLATPTKSGFLIENLLNALMPIIEREVKKAGAASRKRKGKYTKRYHK